MVAAANLRSAVNLCIRLNYIYPCGWASQVLHNMHVTQEVCMGVLMLHKDNGHIKITNPTCIVRKFHLEFHCAQNLYYDITISDNERPHEGAVRALKLCIL